MNHTGTQRIRLYTAAEAVRHALAGAGWSVVVLDGGSCGSKPDLLAAVAGALDAPSWFGHNWDALVDLLRTRAASEQVGLAIVIDHAEHLGACREPLAGIVDELAGEGVPVALHLRSRPSVFRSVP